MNSDWTDLLLLLNASRVKYLLVGGHAVSHYSNPRFTADLDIWIERTPANAKRVWRALAEFGVPSHLFSLRDLTGVNKVIQIGVEPNRIDVLTGVAGLEFADAWERRVESTFGGLPTLYLSKEDLIRNKLASGRPQDLLDVSMLEHAKPREDPVRKKRKK